MSDLSLKPALPHHWISRVRGWLHSDAGRALLLSQGIALLGWLVALWARGGGLPIPVWYDQQTDFTQAGLHLADPYVTPRFVYPPWTAALLLPFSWIPLPLATLVQVCLYFAILTGIVFRLGGGVRTVALALTSFIALDAALELNIDWLVCLGLLVPPAWSGPLLLVKPQVALGAWLSFERRDLVRAVIVTLVVLLVSLALWGAWPMRWLEAVQRYTLDPAYFQGSNLAPMALLSVPISLAVGLALVWLAWRRRDLVLGVLAWLFFVPYLPFYSLLLPFTLAAVRWPRVALGISAATWVIYGGVLALYVLGI